MRKKIIFLLCFISYFSSLKALPNFKRIADFKLETKHSIKPNNVIDNEMMINTNISFLKDKLAFGSKIVLNPEIIGNDKKIKELSSYIKYNIFNITNKLDMYINNSITFNKLSLYSTGIESKILSEFNAKYTNNNLNYNFNTSLITYNLSKLRLNNSIKIDGKYKNIEFIKFNLAFENGFNPDSSFLVDNEIQFGTRPTKLTRLVFNNRFRYISKKEKFVEHKKAGLHIFSLDLNDDNEFTNNFNISLNYAKDDFNYKNINLFEAVNQENVIKLALGTKNIFTYSPFANTKINNIFLIAGISEINNKNYGRFLTSFDIEYTKKFTKSLTISPKFYTEIKVDEIRKINDKLNTKSSLKLIPSLNIFYKIHPLFVINTNLKSTIEFNNYSKQFRYANTNIEAKFSIEYIWR